jgi:hypothetical protein
LEHKVDPELQEHKDLLVLKVHKVHKAVKVHKELLEHKELLA